MNPMTLDRRSFLKQLSMSMAALSGVLLAPFQAMAAWSSKAFHATTLNDALDHLYGSREHTPSNQVELKISKLAQNGAQVPVEVNSSLENVDNITLFVKDNPRPLIVSFTIYQGTLPEVSTRIRLAKSTTVYAIVTANGKRYSDSKKVQVTIGGCGG